MRPIKDDPCPDCRGRIFHASHNSCLFWKKPWSAAKLGIVVWCTDLLPHMIRVHGGSLLSLKITLQEPSRKEAVADAQVIGFLINAQGIKLHLQVANSITKLQEAPCAVVPSLYGGCHEKAKQQSTEDCEELANLKENLDPQRCWIRN